MIIRADSEGITRAVRVMKAGGVVGFPTETFYGLAADPGDEQALRRIFSLKRRPGGEPIPLIAPDPRAADAVAAGWVSSHPLAALWPGPLTLVVQADSRLPSALTAGGGTVAVRVSSHPVATALARAFGGAITSTSANRHGEPPRVTAAAVDAQLPELELILDGGETPGGMPSTLVDLTVDPPRVIRAGAVPVEAVRRILPSIVG